MNYVKGDILSVKHGIIVHSANAQGVMGSGVAKEIRSKYPEVFMKYKSDLKDGMKLGQISWYIEDELIIASIIGQEFYGRDGKRYLSYDAIDVAFDKLFLYAKTANIVSVSMPTVGSGLGGGSWTVIEAIIKNCAEKQKYPEKFITVYEL